MNKSITNFLWISNAIETSLVVRAPSHDNIVGICQVIWMHGDGYHFVEDIFRCIFMNEKFGILIKISPKFVPKGPINNIQPVV